MLRKLNHLLEPAAEKLKEDPVRGHIPSVERVSNNKEVYYWEEDGKVQAMCCVAHCDRVPAEEFEINCTGTDYVIFYTIWSYTPRGGRKLALALVKHFKELGTAKGVYTLSPKTDTARRFHTSNKAELYRENKDTINFYYKLN